MVEKPVVQVIFNPISGNFSSRRLGALTRALEDEGARTIMTSCVASNAIPDPEATHICIAGGDGTIRQVASSLVRRKSRLPVAIFPSGTVNLLAREGKSKAFPRGCARTLLFSENTRPHYPVSISGTMFLACASAGPESAAVARHSPRLKRYIGRLAYAVAFAQLLWSWPRPRIRVSADGKDFDCEAVYIAKGRYFAGPWSFAPKASVSDKLLHVVALKTAGRWDFVRFAVAMLLGCDISKLKGTISFTCTALRAQCDGDTPIQADGDIIARFPLELKIINSPINFR